MAKAWYLKSRPSGMPTPENFELRELARAPLTDGTVRVTNSWLSVDPYMRGRMNEAKSYAPAFKLNEPLEGGAVGTIIESKADGFALGDQVLHFAGWRDEAIVPAEALRKLPDLDVSPEKYLGILGVTGATAYFGLLDVALAKEGDIVFVSAAAGAVGSAVVQLAKARGMTVVGSAGGPAKCDYVRSIGADEVIDYRQGRILEDLRKAAPDGIDVYFDNVGGSHLDAALAVARLHARFAICGMISGYNSAEPVELKFLMRVIAARIRVEGFLILDYHARMDEFYREMSPLLKRGAVQSRETIVEGLERMPDAFLGLFAGENIGKMLIRL